MSAYELHRAVEKQWIISLDNMDNISEVLCCQFILWGLPGQTDQPFLKGSAGAASLQHSA